MRNLKRALSLGLTATMISGLMVMGSSAASYADVTSEQNQEAIEVLKAVDIMVGDEKGNFNPEAKVTRNEMAVVMSNLMAYNVASYKDTSPFTDVPEWAEPYVAACYTNGITSGYDAKTYGGNDSVTTAQAALMVMKALGYFQYQSDFGADWQLSTVAQGNKIDLFDDVDSGVKEAMTRNDLAQLVLNALESGTVEADDDTIKFENGDTTVTAGKVKYNFITSGKDYAYAINDKLATDNNGEYSKGSIVELGEKLYSGDLTKEDGYDDFGRPATVWDYQAKEIGTFAEKADHTFTAKVTSKELYNEVGKTATDSYKWTVSFNGETVKYDGDKLNANKSDDDKDFFAKATGEKALTGNGVVTEVFVDGTDKTVDVAIIEYYAAEVLKVDEDDKTITLSDLDEGPALTTDEFDSTLFEEDEIVIYSYANGDIQDVYAAEKIEGEVTRVRAVTDDSNGDNFVVGGTTYKYNKTALANRLTTDNVDNDVVAYLDANGYVAYIDESAVTYDYAYVLSMGTDDDQYGKGDNKGTTVYARLVLTDGTMVKVETDVKNGDTSLNNHLVSYTVDKNDVYSLSDRSSAKISTDTDLKIENGVAGMNISFNSKERYKRAPPDFGPGCSFYLSNGKVDIVGIQAVHLTGVAVSIPGDPVARPCDSVLCVHDVAVRQMVVAVGHTWDQEETAVVAVLRADRDKLRGTPQGGRKIQGAGMGLSTGPIPGVRPDHQLRHRRPDGLQRRRGSLFRHLRGQSVQGRLVGFFRLRGGQTARKIIQSRVDLGVVLVEIGAFSLVAPLPLIE